MYKVKKKTGTHDFSEKKKTWSDLNCRMRDFSGEFSGVEGPVVIRRHYSSVNFIVDLFSSSL